MKVLDAIVKLVELSRNERLREFIRQNMETRGAAMTTLDTHVDGLDSSIPETSNTKSSRKSEHICPHCGSERSADKQVVQPKVIARFEPVQCEPLLQRMRVIVATIKKAINDQECTARGGVSLIQLQCTLHGQYIQAEELIAPLQREMFSLSYERRRLIELISFGLTSETGETHSTWRSVVVAPMQSLSVKLFAKDRERGALMAGESCIHNIERLICEWERELVPQIDAIIGIEPVFAGEHQLGATIDA
ncbi:MAG TPA: hypothetical protein V6C81_13290 [Planktothrix sp.]|jgi:hypothetical protein